MEDDKPECVGCEYKGADCEQCRRFESKQDWLEFVNR